jgi:hypothetical protein
MISSDEMTESSPNTPSQLPSSRLNCIYLERYTCALSRASANCRTCQPSTEYVHVNALNTKRLELRPPAAKILRIYLYCRYPVCVCQRAYGCVSPV